MTHSAWLNFYNLKISELTQYNFNICQYTALSVYIISFGGSYNHLLMTKTHLKNARLAHTSKITLETTCVEHYYSFFQI
jgi:hypothetical protein